MRLFCAPTCGAVIFLLQHVRKLYEIILCTNLWCCCFFIAKENYVGLFCAPTCGAVFFFLLQYTR